MEEPASGARASASYPAIADYGIIGAMRTCALVSRAGSIDWLCLPSFDSPSVFGRMLDWHRGGYFQVAPRDVLTVERRYLPETNILETTFRTETGAAKVPPPVDAPVLAGIVLKLLVVPGVLIGLAALFGTDVPDTYPVQAAMCTGINTILIADEYGLDRGLTAAVIAWTTAIVVAVGLGVALL